MNKNAQETLTQETLVEKRLQSLIESYELEIEDETKTLKKYKEKLEEVLKESDCLSEVDNSRICSLHRIVERKANQIVLMKRVLSDLEYVNNARSLNVNDDSERNV